MGSSTKNRDDGSKNIFAPSLLDEEYLTFVVSRAQSQNYQAARKLQNIDQLSEIVYTARTNYRKDRGRD